MESEFKQKPIFNASYWWFLIIFDVLMILIFAPILLHESRGAFIGFFIPTGLFNLVYLWIARKIYKWNLSSFHEKELKLIEERQKIKIERESRKQQKINDDIEVERIKNLNVSLNSYIKNDLNVKLIELLELRSELESVKYYKDSTGETLEKSKEYVIYLKHNIPSVLKIWDETEEKRLKDLNKLQNKYILDLANNQNGQVDLIDGESFVKILNKNQKIILEVDKNYIQKFVKISMYLKTKKNNTQKIYESISETKDEEELNELVNLLKNQIHTYELLVFHSINMISSLVDSDLITFYEIYECFDQLGVFNSNWENEVSNKLTNIGDGIRELMYSIYQMETKIVASIYNLTYTTQDSFIELNNSVNNQLSSINSSIKFNNLLTGIQTYQMYRIN